MKGTKAEANKFHDDKNLYTGVHAKGGPSTVDRNNVHDISQTLDRSGADVRGINHNLGDIEAVTHKVAGVVIEEEKKASKPKKKAAVSTEQHPTASANNLEEVYQRFTAGSGGEMDGKTLAKFAKDCKILNTKLTSTDIDLIFAKVK